MSFRCCVLSMPFFYVRARYYILFHFMWHLLYQTLLFYVVDIYCHGSTCRLVVTHYNLMQKMILPMAHKKWRGVNQTWNKTTTLIMDQRQYSLHPGLKGIIWKSLCSRWSMIGGKICSLSSFKHPLINKKAHALVVWPWKCKNCSCKAAN
jgi:hypothetical protein